MDQMRNLLVWSAAAAALAVAVTTHQVAALSPGASPGNAAGSLHKVQKSEEKGPVLAARTAPARVTIPALAIVAGKALVPHRTSPHRARPHRTSPHRTREASGTQRRLKVIAADRCARVIRRSDAPTSASMSTKEGAATDPIGARMSTLLLIADTVPEDAMLMLAWAAAATDIAAA